VCKQGTQLIETRWRPSKKCNNCSLPYILNTNPRRRYCSTVKVILNPKEFTDTFLGNYKNLKLRLQQTDRDRHKTKRFPPGACAWIVRVLGDARSLTGVAIILMSGRCPIYTHRSLKYRSKTGVHNGAMPAWMFIKSDGVSVSQTIIRSNKNRPGAARAILARWQLTDPKIYRKLLRSI
jgi:hypothetical protein